MDGILVIDKPQGPTSHDVVSQLRRVLKIKKVGHTGTLDPMATGVLPLVLGQATKLARYLSGGDKGYLATFRLGITTRTLDAEGEVVSERPVEVSQSAVIDMLQQFEGEIEQIPPMFSAKKIDGQKLYQLARKGLEVPRTGKMVQVHSLRLVHIALPEVTVAVRCTAGTYVRVLAQDIGERLGCGAHLTALRRTEAGPFTLKDAVDLGELLDAPQVAQTRMLPLVQALGALPRLAVPPDMGRMIATGYQLSVADLRRLDTPTFAGDEALAVSVDGGDVIAVVRSELASDELSCARRDRRALKTERVLTPSPRG